MAHSNHEGMMPVESFPGDRRESLDPRLQAAGELLRLVQEETRVLETFQGQKLLDLLPQKDALMRLLHQRMRANRGGGETDRGEAERRDLRECLLRIRAQNERNRRFIENSMAYWRDLVGLLAPTTYNRTGLGGPCDHHAALCGVRINREA